MSDCFSREIMSQAPNSQMSCEFGLAQMAASNIITSVKLTLNTVNTVELIHIMDCS